MRQEPARRSSLFLLEFMISLLFFILASAVCVWLFAKAHTISKTAEDLNIAVQQTSACAEQFRAGMDFPESSCIYYDEDWNICEEDNMRFCLTIHTTQNGAHRAAVFDMTKAGSEESIYTLSLNTCDIKEVYTP